MMLESKRKQVESLKRLTRYFLLLIFAVTVLLSCTRYIESGRTLIPQELNSILSLNMPFTPAKTAWSAYHNTLYVIDSDHNYIYIFKGDKQINKIGGLGFDSENFNKLSDISVTAAGTLLALDIYRNEIKQFDAQGKWLNNHKLTVTRQPYLFDVGRDGTVYIYDKALDEVLIIDENLTEVLHRFGKFYFKEPKSIVSNHRYLTIYDIGSNKTFIFDNFGKLENELSGYWQTDRYGNKSQLNNNMLTVRGVEEPLLLGLHPVTSIRIREGFVEYISGRSVYISEIKYQRPGQVNSVSGQVKGTLSDYGSEN